ncbi:MAG TPA: DUF2155 domain-containing protein [Rhizomicrobium sp.]|jgi:hypothetical protein|nr:DUF2155 domain-containing protein [Rhizomicrobium sp.]
MTIRWRSVIAAGFLAAAAIGAAYAEDSVSINIDDKPAKPQPKPAAVVADPTAAPKAATTPTASTSKAAKPPKDFNPFKIGAPPLPAPLVAPKPIALVLRALDKITARPKVIVAPINQPVQYATLTITARYCYSTPQSETPETSAFVQIDDHRPDQPAKRIFSGWMYASSPGLNGMQHPLYDVWVISCNTDAPGGNKAVASTAVVKAKSPDAGATDEKVDVPEEADQ